MKLWLVQKATCNGYKIPLNDNGETGLACYDASAYSIYFDILKTTREQPEPGASGGKITSFAKLTLKELQMQAKKRKIKYSGLNKQELINALRKSRKNK